jgi:uncharacterized LabA/DUF88 family protein
MFIYNSGLLILMRVSVYIDGANFYHGIKLINKYYSDTKFDFEKFINKITKKEKLISIYYYNAHLKQNLNPIIYKKQQKFFQRLKKIPNCKVIMCKRQKRIDSNGKEYHTIKGDDIHLAIDMLADAYKNRYDRAILLSGDGDFAPVVSYVKKEGKQVINYHFKGNLSRALADKCKLSVLIDRNTVNKFFFRKKS